MPVLRKQDIQGRFDQVIATDRKRRVWPLRTSGSTCEPLIYPGNQEKYAYGFANAWRCRGWWGLHLGVKAVCFYERGFSIYLDWKGRIKRFLVHEVRDRLANYRLFSAYELDEPRMAKAFGYIRKVRPDMLIGYASSLYVFSDWVERSGLTEAARRMGVAGVVSTSEVLYDWQQETIERVWGCPAINEYGCVEATIIAHECPERSWHTMAESMYVEIEPFENADLGEGPKVGEVVLTHLLDHTAPLIRYAPGDLSTLVKGTCRCGRGLPMIDRVQGRKHDLIVTREGKCVHGQLFTHLVQRTGVVQKFQVVQESYDRLSISAVLQAGKSMSEEQETALKAEIRKHLGDQVEIIISYVPELPNEASGKYRWVRSLVTEGKIRAPFSP
ncbi:MAG: phenylacetate--CoA ligase family protein [Bradymonadales bacterium]|nr:phenylacetate--CoA ligase family protein [Bradymonadales bacterium]